MTTFRSLQWFLSLLLACLILLPSLAQKDKKKKNQADDVLRIESDLVQMDVIVTDKQGRLVRDLRREDFEILEEGQPQKLFSFAVNIVGSARTLTAKSATTVIPTFGTPLVDATIGRYVVLAIDDLHIHPGNMIQARDAVLRFVDQQLGEHDHVALYTTSGQMGMFQHFTTDRIVLRRAIARMGVLEMPQIWDEPLSRKKFLPLEAELHANMQAELLAVLSNAAVTTSPAYQPPTDTYERRGGQNAEALEEFAKSDVSRASRMIAEQNRILSTRTFASLLEALRNLRALPERKVMVLFSEGFLMGGGFTGAPITDLSQLTDAATRSDVKVYPIDVRGVPMDATPLERRNTEAIRFPLEHLATNTGGKAFFDNNDINWCLTRVLEDTEAYYQIAFEPLATIRDGRFHNVKVRIPARPELTVRTSKGYLAPLNKTVTEVAPPEAPKTPEQIAAEIKTAQAKLLNDGLAALYPLPGIPLHLNVTASESQDVLVTLLLDATKLKYDQMADRYRTTLEVACNIYDEKGKLATNFSEFLTLNPTAETLYKAVKGGAFRYRRAVSLKPGLYQVRVALREDKETHTGSAAEWVEVPDVSKSQVVAGNITFQSSNAANKAEAKILTGQPGKLDQVDDAQRAVLTQRFRQAAVSDAAIQIYQSASSEPRDFQVEAKIVSRGKVVMMIPNDAIKPGEQVGVGQPYSFKLSSLSLAPGRYELQVEVHDRTAKTATRQSQAFVIE